MLVALISEPASAEPLDVRTICYEAISFSSYGRMQIEPSERGELTGTYEVELHGPALIRGEFTGTEQPFKIVLNVSEHSPDGQRAGTREIVKLADGSLLFYGLYFSSTPCENLLR